MVDTATFRKHKIELTEYDYTNDLQNRVKMSQFSIEDLDVLEEILYSSLRIPLSILEKNLEIPEKRLLSILEKLSDTGLFSIQSEHVIVDKEVRKYYEFQVLKFEDDFKAGMDYLQGLLRKVPIHVLPTWYSIPRSSNNIFESIVEKYLSTPQVFQRYLLELNLSDPAQKGIMNEVYQSPDFEVSAKDMMEKFSLSQDEFETHMIELEFRLVCCVKFVREKGKFKEVITPFHEWRDYLRHVRDAHPAPIYDEEAIERDKETDYAFVEELGALLHAAETGDASPQAVAAECSDFYEEDFDYLIEKVTALELAEGKGRKLSVTEAGKMWLALSPSDKAIYLYRHPQNSLKGENVPEHLCQERMIREAEKCLSSVINSGWVFLEDFLNGIFIPLSEEQLISLKRQGRTWKYVLPKYTESERNFFRALISDWLYEAGMTALGTKDDRICFRLTPFGKELFDYE